MRLKTADSLQPGREEPGDGPPAGAGAESATKGSRLRSVLLSTPFLGAAVCILTWDISFVTPWFGLDGSWSEGLQLAAHQNLQWGPEIVHSYGPLGFLNLPMLLVQGQAVLSLIYLTALHAALCVTLVWALRRALPLAIAVLAAFLLALVPALDAPALLIASWSWFVLDSESRRAALAYSVIGGAIAGLELLLKLNVGIEVLVIVVLCLATLDGRRRNFPLFAAALLVSTLGLWLLAGQSLGNFDLYLNRSAEVFRGYAQAYWLTSPHHVEHLAAALLVGLMMLGIAALGTRSGSRRLLAGVLATTAVFWFALFKEGFIREDPGHLTIFFGTTLVGAALLASRLGRGGEGGAIRVPAIRDPGRLAWAAVGVIAVFAALIWPDQPRPELNPFRHLQTFTDTMHDLVEPSRRTDRETAYEQRAASSYGLDPVTRILLGDHTMYVDPWEVGIVTAYNLNWKPLPIFQNEAYTSSLDEINARALAGPSRPERILRLDPNRFQPDFPTGAIDGRFPGHDSPAARRAQLCNYVDVRTTRQWQVLAPAPHRCGRPRLIRSVDGRYGSPVAVPVPRDRHLVVFARIHGAGPSLSEQVRQLLYRASPRQIALDGPGGGVFRFIPDTAADGLLMWTTHWADFRAPFALGPMARHFTLLGGSGSFHVDFYEIRVRQPGSIAASRGG